MDKRLIILADRDADYRSRLADLLCGAGYRVESAASTVDLICATMEQPSPVLLLGNGFDERLGAAELIHLCKQGNRHLRVILVSDDLPLKVAREVRQEGLFYHALKPATAGDREELLAAVACACRTNPSDRQVFTGHRLPAAATVSRPLAAMPRQAGLRCKALGLALAIFALIFGAGYLSASAVAGITAGGNTIILIFICFCALMIATQFLPIFRIKLPAGLGAKHPVDTKDASPDGK